MYDSFSIPAFEEEYEEEIAQRAKEMIEKGTLDFYEVTLYEAGEIPYEDLYRLAYKIAYRDIEQEIQCEWEDLIYV